MNQTQLIDHSLLRRAVVEIANLPDDELAILLDIVAFLKQQRAESTVDVRRAARERAMTLKNKPRKQLVSQFREVGEKIRGQVVASGTAVAGDWEGD